MSKSALSVRPTLQELKSFLVDQLNPNGFDRYAFSPYPEGIPKGALIEISGSARTTAVAKFLLEHPSLCVLWLEPRFSLFPPHLRQLGVKNPIAFIETQEDVYSSLLIALRSGVFPCIVTTASFEDEKLYKSIRFLSEKARISTFLLCQEHHAYWTIAVQLKADWREGTQGDKTLQIEPVRDKCSKSKQAQLV